MSHSSFRTADQHCWSLPLSQKALSLVTALWIYTPPPCTSYGHQHTKHILYLLQHAHWTELDTVWLTLNPLPEKVTYSALVNATRCQSYSDTPSGTKYSNNADLLRSWFSSCIFSLLERFWQHLTARDKKEDCPKQELCSGTMLGLNLRPFQLMKVEAMHGGPLSQTL